MNQNVKDELALILGLSSLAFVLGKRKRVAAALALASLTMKLLPGRRYSFENRSVVIAGGSRGLGLALAEELVRQKARVALLARDRDELDRAKNHLRGIDPLAHVSIHPCDVTNKDELAVALFSIRKLKGSIDVYIHNAGLISVGPLGSQTKIDLQSSINLHLYAAFNAVDLLVPIFKSQAGGKIVNISSIGGKIAVPHLSSYCAGKFALSGFSKAADIELRPHGIQVTTVYPGLMRTGSPIHAVFKGDQEKEFGWFAVADSTPLLTVSAQNAARDILNGVSMGRSEIIVSIPAKLAIFAHAMFPALVDSLASLTNRLLPKDETKTYLSGASSRWWIDRLPWTKPFRAIRQSSERRYNQRNEVFN